MANLTGPQQLVHGNTTVIDTTLQAPVLSRAYDESGNQYVYLGGVASTVAGKSVTFDTSGSTKIFAADDIGPVAVAMARNISASNYAWYQVYGKATATIADATSGTKISLFISGTAGYLGMTDVAGDFVVGAFYISGTSTGGTADVTVWLNYPVVTNIALN